MDKSEQSGMSVFFSTFVTWEIFVKFLRTSLMCYTLLQEHKVESVYRLIELLLKFGMRNDCRTCLSFLFDYQCKVVCWCKYLCEYINLFYPSSARLASRFACLLGDYAQQPGHGCTAVRGTQSETAEPAAGHGAGAAQEASAAFDTAQIRIAILILSRTTVLHYLLHSYLYKRRIKSVTSVDLYLKILFA